MYKYIYPSNPDSRQAEVDLLLTLSPPLSHSMKNLFLGLYWSYGKFHLILHGTLILHGRNSSRK